MTSRMLLYHPESECLFESDNSEDYPGDGLVEDVTDIEVFENRFRREKRMAKARSTESRTTHCSMARTT